jgi:flavorubredoxin
MENGSWAPTAMNCMKTILADLKNITYIEPEIHIKSSIKQNQIEELDNLADEIIKSM